MDECVSIIVPVIILNFVATSLAVFVGRYFDRLIWETVYEDSFDEELETKEITYSDSSEEELEGEMEKVTDEVTDEDLIESVRSCMSEESLVKKSGLISTINTSINSVLGAVDKDHKLAPEGKQQLQSFLNDIPDLVNKLIMSDDAMGKEVENVLKDKISELTNLKWVKDKEYESEYLMKKLDSLQ